MKLGCCIDLTYYDLLERSGYNTIALAAKDVAAWDEVTLQKTKKKLDSGRLEHISLNNFCPASLRLNGEQYDPKQVETYTKCLAERASYLGFTCVGIGAPASRNIAPTQDRRIAYDQTQEAIQIICDVSAAYDIDILLESVCSLECNMLTTTRETFEFVQKVSRPNLHLVYDIYHELIEQQPIEVIREVGKEIRVVHIAQPLHNQRAYLTEENLPLYRSYYDMLESIGYAGELNLECFVGEPKEELPKNLALLRRL